MSNFLKRRTYQYGLGQQVIVNGSEIAISMIIHTGRSPGSISLGSFPSPYPFGLSMCSTFFVREPLTIKRENAQGTHWEVNTEPFSCDFKLVRSVPVCLRICERHFEIKRKAGTMKPNTTTMVMILCRAFTQGISVQCTGAAHLPWRLIQRGDVHSLHEREIV